MAEIPIHGERRTRLIRIATADKSELCDYLARRTPGLDKLVDRICRGGVSQPVDRVLRGLARLVEAGCNVEERGDSQIRVGQEVWTVDCLLLVGT